MARLGWSARLRRRRRPQASSRLQRAPRGEKKVPVCQRETVGLAKAGPRAFCTKLQNWCRGFGGRTTSDFRAMTV